MKRKSTVRILVALALTLVTAIALSGCMTAANTANDEQAANREYMAQVNSIMDDLYAGLQDFNETVSNNDIVGMRVQADRAFRAIDDLKGLEPPDNLSDLQSEYVAGCEALSSALSDFIDLYTEIDTATEDQPFDYAVFEEEIESIREQYNEGIDYLESADSMAAEM